MAVSSARTKVTITSLYALKPGDHIKVNEGLYDHHMIVVNVVSYNTITVIHKRKQQPAVVEEDIYCYTPDKIIRMVYYSPYNQQEIIERARQRIGEKYNLLFANYEHFATEVRTGTAVSLQVETVSLLSIMFSVGAWIGAMCPIVLVIVCRVIIQLTNFSFWKEVEAITIKSMTLWN